MLNSKLLSLKKYVTLPEASERLTKLFGEDISIVDILEWVLDKKIVLSVKFPYGVKVIACRYGERKELKSTKDKRMFLMFYAPKQIWKDKEYYQSDEYKSLEMEFLEKCYHETLEQIKKQYENKYDDQYQDLINKFTFDYYLNEALYITSETIGHPFYLDNDIYNFPLIGTETVWIENIISSLKEHKIIERFSIDGAFISDDEGNVLSVQERFDDFSRFVENCEKGSDEYKDIKRRYRELDSEFCYPADNFPEDHELVITTKHLLEFERSVIENDSDVDYEKTQLLVASMLKVLKGSNPKKWTQGELSDIISEQAPFKGLGKRKIDSFFSQCNKLLDISMK